MTQMTQGTVISGLISAETGSREQDRSRDDGTQRHLRHSAVTESGGAGDGMTRREAMEKAVQDSRFLDVTTGASKHGNSTPVETAVVNFSTGISGSSGTTSSTSTEGGR